MRKRALLSVSNKTGIVDFARRLSAAGFEILSTGGTQKELSKAGISSVSIEDVTKFPECFSGRVKTMHPKIAGGILMRRGNPDDEREAKENGIEPIDLVCVNLYPFEEAVKNGASGEELIEQIDIGGPTLLRSAAKNHVFVTVLCDPEDYGNVISMIEKQGDTTPELRSELAAKVFLKTAAYDGAITDALSQGTNRAGILVNGFALRYGENPHQEGWYYDTCGVPRPWKVLQEEKQMSYLNILDADAAWNLVREFSSPSAACIKHANPSGVASDRNVTDAFQRAYDSDKLSAFGVIIALNEVCPEGVIGKIIEQKIFVEVVIAPGFEPNALELLKKKPKIRAIEIDPHAKAPEFLVRSSLGGALIQTPDTKVLSEKDLVVVSEKKPTKDQIQDMLFAWTVVKHAKSNAIVFAKDTVTVGIGCGQTSRVDATWIAARRAGDKAKGAIMASDAFFPFPDSVEEAAKHGIAAIIQPGGSIRDAEVIAKANELGIAMVTTGVRGFRH